MYILFIVFMLIVGFLEMQIHPAADIYPTGSKKETLSALEKVIMCVFMNMCVMYLSLCNFGKALNNDEVEGSDEDDGDIEESYDDIEGAYNTSDYQQLNVSTEVSDLFQYIDSYKPHGVQMKTPLKSFIPEYIPAIGEQDAFIKVPRPDGKEDGLGMLFLDEVRNTLL